MPKGEMEPIPEFEKIALMSESEIIPPEEDIANGKISITGDQYDLIVADNKDPEKISSWIANKSGDRVGTINHGNDGLEAKKEEFNEMEGKDSANKE